MMRKLIWYCSAVGVLAAGGFLSLGYYACHHTDSLLGRCLYTIAEASLSIQPLNGLASRAVRSSQEDESYAVEEQIPDDPKPIIVDVTAANTGSLIFEEMPVNEEEADAAPIVIPEDDPITIAHVEEIEIAVPAVPSTINLAGMREQEIQAKGCRLVMPYCQDDGEHAVTPPIMPYAEDGEEKPSASTEKTAGDSSEEAERKAFKEWMQLLESTEEGESAAAEELPPPTEDQPGTAPKCQEDSHRHEQYPGCPPMICPRGGKSHPSGVPAKKRGHEESSEEPPSHGKKPKNTDERPRTQGVDTMEYRPSDGGLNEYDYGPLHW